MSFRSEKNAGSETGCASSGYAAQIEEALRRRDLNALRNKRERLTFAVTAAALGPTAVLLLVLEMIFGFKGPLAITLIVLELLALLFALAIPVLGLDQSHYRWLSERLRAELLRREKFLLSARVGPYLSTPESTIALRVEQRLAILDDDINDAFSLLAMADRAVTWRNALEDARHTRSLTAIPDSLQKLETYLHERIVGQRSWYSKNSARHGNHAWWFEGGSKVTLTFALIVAAIHLGLELDSAGVAIGEKLSMLGAVLLPSLGAALIGLLSIFGCRRLSRSYLHHARALERLEDTTRNLQAEVEENPLQNEDASFHYRRILLETEELLSDELRLWWLYMHPEAPRTSA